MLVVEGELVVLVDDVAFNSQDSEVFEDGLFF